MHNVFRTLGQQMGMQLIRAILPESIDVFLNEVINEKVRSVVLANSVTAFQDRVSIQDNSVSPINYVRTLYRTAPSSGADITVNDEFYKVAIDSDVQQKTMFYTSFVATYGGNVSSSTNPKRYGCRFIEGDKLYDTLRDYCNRASHDYPVVTMRADENNREFLEVYIGDSNKELVNLDIAFIERPAIVKWSTVETEKVNCNLPVYTHNEIVELAVGKYFQSVGATTRPVPQN